MDADSTSMKISQNILNQKAPNAAHKHILQIYSECPDKEFNIGQLMGVFNKGLNEFKYKQITVKILDFGTVHIPSKFGSCLVCQYHLVHILALIAK